MCFLFVVLSLVNCATDRQPKGNVVQCLSQYILFSCINLEIMIILQKLDFPNLEESCSQHNICT